MCIASDVHIRRPSCVGQVWLVMGICPAIHAAPLELGKYLEASGLYTWRS